MNKLLWSLAAGVLVTSTLSLQAGEKRYRIRIASEEGTEYGKPVAFQEIVPSPEAAQPGEGLDNPPPAPGPLEAPGGLQPIPEQPVPQQPFGQPVPMPPSEDPVYHNVELYPHVEYEDLDNIHPQAVKKIVAVKDPRFRGKVCGTCEPPCVYVMICVPPCDKFKYDVKRKDHSKVEYDYGDYEIEIKSKNGIVYVDYDD